MADRILTAEIRVMSGRQGKSFKILSSLVGLVFFIASIGSGNDIAWCLDTNNTHSINAERLQPACCHATGSSPLTEAENSNETPALQPETEDKSCFDIMLGSLCSATRISHHLNLVPERGVLWNTSSLTDLLQPTVSLSLSPFFSLTQRFLPLRLKTNRTVVLLV